MELIARRHPVDVAILPIGGHYTMDRHDAAYAAGLIGAGTVIPCHYDTFPPIETDAEAFKADVEDAELVRGRDPRAGRGARGDARGLAVCARSGRTGRSCRHEPTRPIAT